MTKNTLASHVTDDGTFGAAICPDIYGYKMSVAVTGRIGENHKDIYSVRYTDIADETVRPILMSRAEARRLRDALTQVIEYTTGTEA